MTVSSIPARSRARAKTGPPPRPPSCSRGSRRSRFDQSTRISPAEAAVARTAVLPRPWLTSTPRNGTHAPISSVERPPAKPTVVGPSAATATVASVPPPLVSPRRISSRTRKRPSRRLVAASVAVAAATAAATVGVLFLVAELREQTPRVPNVVALRREPRTPRCPAPAAERDRFGDPRLQHAHRCRQGDQADAEAAGAAAKRPSGAPRRQQGDAVRRRAGDRRRRTGCDRDGRHLCKTDSAAATGTRRPGPSARGR